MEYLVKISDKAFITHNVLRITLKSEKELPQFKVSSFIKIYDNNNNFRPYSPLETDPHNIFLTIKVYKK